MIDILAQASEPASLGERLLVATVGPLVSALVGTGLIGWIVWRLTDRAQVRRADADRALEQQRADNQLRHELLTAVMTTASALYHVLQIYRRTKDDPASSSDDERDARRKLDDQYHKCRTETRLIEVRVATLFDDDSVAVNWHRIVDLLLVRYMQLTGRATASIYAINEVGYQGGEHSGLTVNELKDPEKVLAAYHSALKAVAQGVLTRPVRARQGQLS